MVLQLPTTTIWLAGVQWLFFIFANTVVVPLSVGAAFQLPPEEVAAALQRSFIFTGIACMLQALIGHRYALMEGHSGMWWGLILSLCASAPAAGISLEALGGGLATGVILAGLTIIMMGLLGFSHVLRKVFTPLVMSVYLFLLTTQLVIIFFQGMIGLASGEEINVPVASLSIAVAILVGLLIIKGRGLISNFAILIGIIVGWVAYVLLFPSSPEAQHHSASLFSLFPWGWPNLEIGIVITTYVAGLINLSNTIASISAAEKLYQTKTTEGQYRNSFIQTGTYSIVSAVFGLVPYSPYASSIGFLESTRILARSALVIGGGLFMLLGLVPALGNFFSTMPISIGNTVLFVAYLQMFGSALRNIEGIRFNSKTIYRISTPIMLGICVMNLPPELFTVLPVYVQPLVSNGLIMGVLLSLALETFMNWSKFE